MNLEYMETKVTINSILTLVEEDWVILRDFLALLPTSTKENCCGLIDWKPKKDDE